MKMDLSCPLEMRGYSLKSEDGAAEAEVYLFNASGRRISSFEAVAKWRSSSDGRSLAAPFAAEGLRAAADREFILPLSCGRLPDADRLDLLFTSVSYEDGGADWRLGEGTVIDAAPMVRPAPEQLALLQTAAGEDAVCFPVEEEKSWRCVCGKVNLDGTEICERCRRSRADVLRFTPESVHFQCRDEVSAEDAPESEEMSRLHAQYMRQRSRLLRRTLVIGAAILALTALILIRESRADVLSAAADCIFALI